MEETETLPTAPSIPPPPPPRRVVSAPPLPHPPPPKRTVAAKPLLPYSSTAPPTNESWGAWTKRKGSGWGKTAVVKGTSWSDTIGGRINGYAEGMGSERFWPVTNDAIQEIEKCARILKVFTEGGVEQTVVDKDSKGNKKQRKVLRKIPAAIIREAKGLAIFTSMRSGLAPFGGAGGAGVVVAKMEDGTWSGPSFMSPNNLTAGAMIGVDVYDCVLVMRTQQALESFFGFKATLGAELAVAAGPYGAGGAAEIGVEKAPVLSYTRSRGLYAGIEAVAQIFIERADENGTFYYWPGVKPKDILRGGVKLPREVEPLMDALFDAETGRAQRRNGADQEFESPFPEVPGELELEEWEVLRLPPTPDQLEQAEKEEEIEQRLKEKKENRWYDVTPR